MALRNATEKEQQQQQAREKSVVIEEVADPVHTYIITWHYFLNDEMII